jgi:hypothetical protein
MSASADMVAEQLLGMRRDEDQHGGSDRGAHEGAAAWLARDEPVCLQARQDGPTGHGRDTEVAGEAGMRRKARARFELTSEDALARQVEDTRGARRRAHPSFALGGESSRYTTTSASNETVSAETALGPGPWCAPNIGLAR